MISLLSSACFAIDRRSSRAWRRRGRRACRACPSCRPCPEGQKGGKGRGASKTREDTKWVKNSQAHLRE